MSTTTTDDGFHEIQLNGKELVFLFMAVTVVSVVIFLCGVLVGRGVRVESAGAEAGVSEPVAQVALPLEAPPIVSPPGSGMPASAQEDLTYSKRLGSADPPRDDLRPAPSAPTTTQPAPPAPKASGQAATTAAAAPSAAEPPGRGFAIQLAALRQRDEADAIARRLTAKGYQAYVMTPDRGAPAVFRVRVGKFKERREAEAVAARLKQEEQFNPWIAR